jgi:hypothetical protein
MREAQRRGREDALSGRDADFSEVDLGDAWMLNYMLGRQPQQLAPLPWPTTLLLALESAAWTELFEHIRPWNPAIPLILFPRGMQPRLARQRAAELGLGPNDELPLLRRSPHTTWLAAVPVLAVGSALARRAGVRRSVIHLGTLLTVDVARRYGWRRAGLPTSPPPGRGRASGSA